MRITFLTGCVERGKDGVGDYTRALALECARRGASCQIVALHDPHVGRAVAGPLAPRVEVFRLPRDMSWTSRTAVATNAIQFERPDCVSVQFVPYSFHRWGLAHRLVRALPGLRGRARLHVMLHEIWIGGEGSWRRRLISAGQRNCVRHLARQPGAVLHTSNATYQQMLMQHGVHAGVLPLFGSMPIASADASPWLFPALASAGCADVARRRTAWWLCGFFGTLHPIWPPEPLLERLQAAAACAGTRVALIAVGRMGSGASVWQRMRAQYGARVPMLSLGEQPEHRISEVLNTVDFGIAASPYSLLGKSATAAAMIDHGVPIIVNREDGPPAARDWPEDPREATLVIRMNETFPMRLRQARRLPPRSRLPEVAGHFLAALQQSPPPVRAWSS